MTEPTLEEMLNNHLSCKALLAQLDVLVFSPDAPPGSVLVAILKGAIDTIECIQNACDYGSLEE